MTLKFRNILKHLLLQSGGMSFERFDGDIAPVSLTYSGSVSRNITESEIAVDQNNLAIWNYSFSSTKNMITSIDIWYKPILPMRGSGGWMGRKYCRRTGTALDSLHNIDSADSDGNYGAFYSGLLEGSYQGLKNQEKPLVIYLPGIRDDTTAEHLLRLLVWWRCRQLAMLSLTCTYSVMNIELLDKIGVTAGIITDYSFLSSLAWLVVGKNITPALKNKNVGVQLNLMQMGESNPPATLDWTDTLSTGTEKIDLLNTGDSITEVL